MLRAATHETSRGDHDFCLSRSHGQIERRKGKPRKRSRVEGKQDLRNRPEDRQNNRIRIIRIRIVYCPNI